MTQSIRPAEKDLGEFTVRRVLPHLDRRSVGPFVFFDHIGPAEFPPGEGIQVRPHPHIGLATVTFLFDGEIIHRDSLEYVQPIRPGAVNLMTAGRGIVHSERAGDDLHETSSLHGLQLWMALPLDEEECEPAFEHYPASDIPEFEVGDVKTRLIMGIAFGHASPVQTKSETLYMECKIPRGSAFELPGNWRELGAYVVSGKVKFGTEEFEPGVMFFSQEDTGMSLLAEEDCHLVFLGGDPLGKRIVWWNLVSSSRERIEKAKSDWKEGRFAMVPGDTEFIPLPEN